MMCKVGVCGKTFDQGLLNNIQLTPFRHDFGI